MKKKLSEHVILIHEGKTHPKRRRKFNVRKDHKNANFVVSFSAQRKIL